MPRDPSRTVDDDLSTILRPKFDPTPAAAASFALNAIEGRDRGKTFIVDGAQVSRVLLGKSTICELRLTDPEVSRRHAALEVIGHQLRIQDLQSRNGTLLDGVSIVDAYAQHGQVLRIGSTALAIVSGPPADVTLPIATSFGRVMGASTEMRRLYPLCARIAASSVAVIIEGETGTGKEALAESLHEEGPRASGPFIVFDCTAVPANLVESELFGHERGAFTGASATRKGLFEQAHGGTLLIDEIGDLDAALQPKLLRALERSEVRRVGGDRTIRVDVRVMSATRRDLDREVQEGRFRDDLFHRLVVARIELPPLRRRAGDVPLLARHFARALGGADDALPGDLLTQWRDYSWPGNVRELRNAVARRLALGDLATLPSQSGRETASPARDATLALRAYLEQVLADGVAFGRARDQLLDVFEQTYIAGVLEAHGGNVTRAAAACGIARRHFHRLLARGHK